MSDNFRMTEEHFHILGRYYCSRMVKRLEEFRDFYDKDTDIATDPLEVSEIMREIGRCLEELGRLDSSLLE